MDHTPLHGISPVSALLQLTVHDLSDLFCDRLTELLPALRGNAAPNLYFHTHRTHPLFQLMRGLWGLCAGDIVNFL
jgi:hypothetical protein